MNHWFKRSISGKEIVIKDGYNNDGNNNNDNKYQEAPFWQRTHHKT